MAILNRLPWLLTLALAACAREPTRIALDERYLAVHSVVETGAQTATVLLTWNLPSGAVRGADGATVFLNRGPERWQLRPNAVEGCSVLPDGLRAGCYGVVLDRPLQPGEPVTLAIGTEGASAEAVATLPPHLEVVQPSSGEAVTLECAPGPVCQPTDPRGLVTTVPVRFRAAPALRRIETSLTARHAYRAGRPLPDAACTIDVVSAGPADPLLRDSLAVYLREVRCVAPSGAPLEWDSIAAEIHVTAYDSAYARYQDAVEAFGTARPAQMAAGVRGAVGVFAGASRVVVPLSLRRAGVSGGQRAVVSGGGPVYER
jgi:hypothetical protein